MPDTSSYGSGNGKSSGNAAQASPTAPLVIGSSMVHMYTRIRRKEGNSVSYRWVTHLPQIVTAPCSPRAEVNTERSGYSPTEKPQRTLILQGAAAPSDALPPRSSSSSTVSPLSPSSIRDGRSSSSESLLHSQPQSGSETSPLSPPTPSSASFSARRTRSEAVNVEGIYGASFAPRSKPQKSAKQAAQKSQAAKSPSSPNSSIHPPSLNAPRAPRVQPPPKLMAGSVYGLMLDPLKPYTPIARPPLPPTLAVRATSKPAQLNTPPVLQPRQNSPPTPTPDQPIAFHLRASIDQFTTTTTVPIPTSKVNDLATRGALFYFLEIQHQILMREWSNMHDGYGVIKMAQNPFGGSSSSGVSSGLAAGTAPVVPSWNTITAHHLKAHHPTAPTRLNYLPPTIHLAMPNGRDVGPLIQWAMSHDFKDSCEGEEKFLEPDSSGFKLPESSRKLLAVLNDPYDTMQREIRFLHLIQTANRLGMTDAASLATLTMTCTRPESMYFTLSEAHIHFPIYAPLSCWMLENWSTSFFSHPDFPSLWYHNTSGMDESFIIKLAILFQRNNNTHGAVTILRQWAGRNDPRALKALSNRVADVTSNIDGSFGQELLHSIWETIHNMEVERGLGVLNQLDKGLEAREKEILELEEWAKESMGDIERVVEGLTKKEVEGLAEYQRKAFVKEKRGQRAEMTTYDSDATAVASAGSASEDDSNSPPMKYRDISSKKEKFLAITEETGDSSNDDELENLTPPSNSPPPPPTAYDESSFFSPTSRDESFFPDQEDRTPSDQMLQLLNESGEQVITVDKHDSQDIEDMDEDFYCEAQKYPQVDPRLSTVTDTTSILTVSSTKSAALFDRVSHVRKSAASMNSRSSRFSGSIRPESVWTVNDHTRSGFFDEYYNQDGPTTSSSSSSEASTRTSAARLGDWGRDEDDEPTSPIEESERSIERWVASVAFWEYGNWKREVRKMKSSYVEPNSSSMAGREGEEFMKMKDADVSSWEEEDERALVGHGAGVFGGCFEDDEEDDESDQSGGFNGILKRFHSVAKSAAGFMEGKNGANGIGKQQQRHIAHEQEFCWSEGLKGGEVDGDVIVASVMIVRDSSGHIVNSTIYPRRL
ncbi:hypothetical protein BDR26DRAFT_938256 [Obelidium mucronatum]|nr:hypothetical protein BDR26DRAFT_938256 [Obelidium mucronatum]